MLTDILSIALNAMKINKKFRILLTNTFQGYSIKLVMYRKGINRADTMMPCMQVCRVWQEWRISMEYGEYHKRMRTYFDEHTLSGIEPILEGMPGGLFIYHADGDEELMYINSAVLRIFGC